MALPTDRQSSGVPSCTSRRRDLAELLGSLSLATEAAAGVAPETSIRAAVVSLSLARAHGLDEEACSAAFLTCLLRYIGCTAFSAETAWYGGGDDIALLGDLTPMDAGRPLAALGHIVRTAGHRAPLVTRVRTVGRILGDPALPQKIASTHCAQAVALTESLGLGAPISMALGDIYERFDGKGGPAKKKGAEISPIAQIARTSLMAVIHGAIEGPDAGVAVVRTRAGGEVDPSMAATFQRHAAGIFREVMQPSAWDLFVASAAPRDASSENGLDLSAIALSFARCVDLKSPWTLAHSTGVAALCREALARAGAPAVECEAGYVSGLLHDLGRLSVPNGIWDKKGILNALEWQRVRSHASVSEVVVSRSAVLAMYAPAIGTHHERLDGSGYPRQTKGQSSSRVALTLAAADVFHALTEDRPHRRGRPADAAAAMLRDEVRAGRLDGGAAESVCAAAGAPKPGLRGELPMGLSEREVDVLKLLARGLSNKEIGQALFISDRTAGNHIAHIFQKTGIKTRAAAALFAVTRGLA
jgi:HD-GYP domain-containing protein (c-di-GMP phosphodiesterase class II)/DNA-binding CsgD family transcriptional regulator